MHCCRRPNAPDAVMPGCSPYAAAIAAGEAQINQCPPGGAATIDALARLLSRAALPLNPANGTESAPRVAWIDEARCIGCARCLAPCPVDAIVGAQKYLHTVLADRCTGCELCLPPCPVDCIEMRAAPASRRQRRRAEQGALRRAYRPARSSSRGTAAATRRQEGERPRAAQGRRESAQAPGNLCALSRGEPAAADRAASMKTHSSCWSRSSSPRRQPTRA